MQRNGAMMWFGPFLVAAALAAAVVLALAALVEPKMLAAAPPEAASPARPKHVIIEPSRIEVVGIRSAAPFAARADTPSRRKQPG